MNNILIRADGDYFRHDRQKIPKFNYRTLSLEKAEIDSDRKLELSVSSDLPYQRWYYYEELEHSEAAVDLSRFNDSAMLLFNHNRDDYIGVIERAWLDGGKCYNTVRFDTHELAERIYQSVQNDIVRNVSIGYRVDELVLVKKSDSDMNTYRATSWMPFETSLVTVPADASVGVGRSFFDFGENSDEKAEGRGVMSEGDKTTSALSPQPAESSRACDSDLKSESVPTSAIEENNKSEGITMPVESPTIDKDKLLTQERERTASIYAVGSRYNCPELAAKAVEEGWSIEKMRSHVLDREPEQQPVASVSSPVDLDNKEAANYSCLKAVGFLAGKLSQKEAGLEIEVSDHIQDSKMRGKAPEGIYFDSSRLMSREQRAPLETGVPAAAGDLIATDLLGDRLLSFLYNNSAFMPLGVTILRDLTANIKIPRTITAPTAYWVEEGQNIPEDNLSFDTIGLDPKKIAVFSSCTFEMIQQAENIDLEQMMRNALITAITLEIDRTIGLGSGVGEEPLGIAGTPGVNSFSLGADGGALDYSALIIMQELIDARNALMGSFGYVMNSRTKGRLMRTLDHDTGGGSWIWQNGGLDNEGRVAGYRARCSNQIPNNFVKGTANNLTAAIFGNFSQVMLGFWSILDIMVDPYTQAKQAIINIIAKQLCDLEIARGDYFTVLTDIQNN